jgi:hypothetical protein
MAKWYGSFLVRCWHLADDAQRLEIEHIQSGARVRVATVAAAVAWMSARESDEARPPDPAETRSTGLRASVPCGCREQ